MPDCFDEIHKLLKAGDYEAALSSIYDYKNNRIYLPFQNDLNHAWYIVGDIFYKQGDIEYAISCFKKALSDWPEDVEAICALGSCYSYIAKPEKAEGYLSKGLLISPGNPTLLYNYANALFDQKKYRDAIRYFRKIEQEEEIYSLAQSNIKKAKKKLQQNP